MVEIGQIIVTGLLGGSVFLMVWSLGRYPAASEPPTHRRFAAAMGTAPVRPLFDQGPLAGVMSLLLQVARRTPGGGVRNLVRQDLDAAGNPNGYSHDEYLALCLGCAIVTGLGAALLTFLFTGGTGLFVPAFAAAAGLALPLWILHNDAARRAQRIGRQLPYSLDLIALMMQAGSTFTEAVTTLITDDPHDDLNQELRIVLAEIEFGAKRSVAMANLAQRIPLDALRSIIGAVNQADALGTPLAEILKNQANMLRMYRSVQAEKLAASASLRILLPSMLILLAVVLFVFTPMILQWREGGLM
jgi:tight adherence protein C